MKVEEQNGESGEKNNIKKDKKVFKGGRKQERECCFRRLAKDLKMQKEREE